MAALLVASNVIFARLVMSSSHGEWRTMKISTAKFSRLQEQTFRPDPLRTCRLHQ